MFHIREHYGDKKLSVLDKENYRIVYLDGYDIIHGAVEDYTTQDILTSLGICDISDMSDINNRERLYKFIRQNIREYRTQNIENEMKFISKAYEIIQKIYNIDDKVQIVGFDYGEITVAVHRDLNMGVVLEAIKQAIIECNMDRNVCTMSIQDSNDRIRYTHNNRDCGIEFPYVLDTDLSSEEFKWYTDEEVVESFTNIYKRNLDRRNNNV